MSMTDGELAIHLAEVAGKILLEVRASGMFEGKRWATLAERCQINSLGMPREGPGKKRE